MSNLRPTTSKTLTALKGWPTLHAVDYEAQYDPSLAGTFVPPGAVVRLSPAGKYLLGVGSEFCMPMFIFSASTDTDVDRSQGGDPATDKFAYVSFSPSGGALALPAKGAYELLSTHFVPGQNYSCNTPLTSPATGPNAGLLTPGNPATDTIVGIVSRPGLTKNGWGYDAVAFWPVCQCAPSNT
jgi:hypothetical protein